MGKERGEKYILEKIALGGVKTKGSYFYRSTTRHPHVSRYYSYLSIPRSIYYGSICCMSRPIDHQALPMSLLLILHSKDVTLTPIAIHQ